MKRAERFWDRAANTYDQEEKKDEHSTLKIIEKTKEYLKNSDIVLDYGCGTGTIDIEIAGNAKSIKAIDISSNMVNLAKKKTSARQITNIDYSQSTIFDERLINESFDAVTAFNVLHLLEDAPGEMKRINELLKPRGLFISSTPCMGEKRFVYYLYSLLSKIGLIPVIAPFRYPELKEIVVDSNFEIIETERLYRSSPLYFIAARKK